MPAGFAPAPTDRVSSLDLHHRLESVPTKTACQEKGSNSLLRPQKLRATCGALCHRCGSKPGHCKASPSHSLPANTQACHAGNTKLCAAEHFLNHCGLQRFLCRGTCGYGLPLARPFVISEVTETFHHRQRTLLPGLPALPKIA